MDTLPNLPVDMEGKPIDQQMLLIRDYDLFSCITDQEYEDLKLEHHFIVAPKDEYIYFESHHLSRLFFLKKGFIKIGHINENGEEVVREIIRKGEVFGQITLERNNLMGEFAKAYRSEVSLCSWQIDEFEKLLRTKPEMAIQFSKKVGNKLRQTGNRLTNLLRKDVRERLVHFLADLMVELGHEPGEKGFSGDNFLTHQDIARLIGASRQTVTTLLGEMSEAGILTMTRSRLECSDVKRLLNS
jgi:CRP/FNR family cyclic AMP-dependent transcriptional regulator